MVQEELEYSPKIEDFFALRDKIADPLYVPCEMPIFAVIPQFSEGSHRDSVSKTAGSGGIGKYGTLSMADIFVLKLGVVPENILEIFIGFSRQCIAIQMSLIHCIFIFVLSSCFPAFYRLSMLPFFILLIEFFLVWGCNSSGFFYIIRSKEHSCNDLVETTAVATVHHLKR